MVMNVLSLFNGMSTGHTALDNVGIKVGKYYSSEIKPAAIKLTQHHYPDTIQLGDVTKWKEWDIDWKNIDMVLSGSPCQDLSIAGKQKGLEGERSSLFWVFIDILNHIKELNPKVLFLQENVGSANKRDVGIMSRALGVYPVRINSKLVTAQLRDRYYWSNIRTAPDGMFGDIITDLGAMIQGGMGIAAGGNINPEGVSMFEPIGGSAPKYTGKNIINPLASIAAASMMLNELGEEKYADDIEKAIISTAQTLDSLSAGKMGMSTEEVGDSVVEELSNLNE